MRLSVSESLSVSEIGDDECIIATVSDVDRTFEILAEIVEWSGTLILRGVHV